MTARGIRNNNPGNIVVSGWTQRQHGYMGPEPEGRFARFWTMAHGIAALLRLLRNYRIAHGLTTVRGIINRWAPGSENNTEAYIAAVCAGWRGPDEELPDDAETYLELARRIARHECGPEAASIGPEEWRAALTLTGLAQAPAPSPIPPPPPAPTPATAPATAAPAPLPQPETPKMPAPIGLILAAAEALLPTVADLFRGHGGKTAERNADIITKAGPAIVEIAKEVTGEAGVSEAVTAVLDSPEATAKFRARVEADLDRLVGLMERLTRLEDESRDKAAARAQKDTVDLAPALAREQFWVVCGAGAFLAAVAAADMALDGSLSEGILALLATFVGWALQKRGTIVDYRFGSSAGSAAKDEVIAASRAGRP